MNAHLSEESVVAPMAGLVVSVPVKIGERVQAGDAICVTETMKCESTLVAATDGWVVTAPTLGATCDAGDVLARISVFPPSTQRIRWTPDAVVELVCTASDALPEAGTGRFVEHDLDGDRLVPVDRPLGAHSGGVVVGLLSHELRGHPEGLERVLICGDPTRSMGAVAEQECRLIIGAIELARERRLSIEWVAVSAGARIAWDSGTENMDWCAEVARHIVTFTQGDSTHGDSTQDGGAINVIVAGVNVGAQSYWNALATMLWHTAGMLVMIAEHSMVLTGRRALALSGGGHHDSEAAMGGYAEVMGPNGEAHHVVGELAAAYRLLFDHLALCEPARDGLPPRSSTSDDAGRNICDSPCPNGGWVGDVLDARTNPKRKRSFAIRPVMAALADADAERLERWSDQAGGHPAVVWDTRLGGWPVTLIGIESQPVVDLSTPDRRVRASGTLFPQASRKIARALNSATGRRGCVVLANLAGFDGSAESMLGRQLEYGAEIARAVVNYRGPIVVVVIGRFHGGAYVVFSRRLNPSVTVLALEGTYVSVIGGDAAAGVVFGREVADAVEADLAECALTGPALRTHRNELEIRHRARIARRFDEVHSVTRAAEVGSVDAVVRADDLRRSVIDQLDRWDWRA